MIFFEEVPELKNTIHRVNMPLAMSHFIYRNTIVEDYHADGKPLTEEQAKILYNYMYSYLLKFNEMRNSVTKIIEKRTSVEEMTPEEIKEFSFYMGALSFSTRCGSNWDEPEDVSEIEYSKFCEKWEQLDACYILEFEEYLEGVIAYLWNGELGKAFANKIVLTDEAMKIINKDIHNKLNYLYNMVINDDEEIADLLTAYAVTSNFIAEKVEIVT
jgi:hypothetical protein